MSKVLEPVDVSWHQADLDKQVLVFSFERGRCAEPVPISTHLTLGAISILISLALICSKASAGEGI